MDSEEKMKRPCNLPKRLDASALAIGFALILFAVLCLLAFIKVGLK